MAANRFASPNSLKLFVENIVTIGTYFFQAKFTFSSSLTKLDSVSGIKYFNNFKFISCVVFQATCATSGDGLYEGLDWLSNQLKNANR